MRVTRSRLILSLSLALGAVGAQALTFNLSSTGNAQADAGFREAADLWSAQFLDPITINIAAGYRGGFTNPDVIGSAGSATVSVGYQTFRNAIIADARYPQNGTDPQVIASLPDTTGIAWRRSDLSTGATVLDNDNSTNNNFLSVNRANAKALGLLSATSTTNDATITFNSDFAFDFDRSNGIDPNQVDFVGVAFHEIGHALGFVSGVDRYDSPRTTDTEASLNATAVFSPLDLLRYGASDGVKDVRFNSPAYFSLDQGVTNLANFSTGAARGDRRQASHWKDDGLTGTYLGAMDPTLARGQLVQFSVRDGAALDAIGYDVVPEPATVAALGLGTLALLRRRRSKKS